MQLSFAQEKTVTGSVTDGKVALPMANVVIKGTKQGIQADMDGNFSIKVKQGDVLVVSYTGYTSKEVTVGSASTYRVVLKEESKVLEEVVVQGYRTVSKKTAVSSSASVTNKTIENRPNANVMNTLQGQLAGVNITASSGQPGAKSSVIIRGLGTINGNSDPLYVIDGFPTNADNFRSINPNDIASVEVLKDASAVSEYGSRASNGVVVIKTKKGSYGDAKTTFRYTSTIGMTELQTPRYKYANSKELLTIEKLYGTGLGSTLTDQEIANFAVDTDWVNYFFRKGTSTSHNLTIENSSKNLNAFTSVGYFEQEGVLKTTGLKRFTVRNNINGKSTNEKFKYSINTGLGFSKNNEATNLGGGAVNRNYVLGAYISAPYISPDEYVNSWNVYQLYDASPNLLYTPLFLVDKLKMYKNLTDETRVNVSTEYSYQLLKDLTLRGRSSGELLATRFVQSEFPDSFNAILFSTTAGNPNFLGGNFNGFEDINNRREFRYNQLWQADYSKTFGKHTVDVIGSMEFSHSRVNANNSRQRGLNPKTFVWGTGAGYVPDNSTANDNYGPTISVSELKYSVISYFGSLDYDYAKKYGMSATIRKDQSSKFLKSNNAKAFWSVGARWNMDEEEFMKKLTFINTLKLRGSYGTVGNQRIQDGTEFTGINPPLYADIYSAAGNVYNGGNGWNILFGDQNLTWEPTKQGNIGVDFELFKKRLRGSVDRYSKRTVDLFLDTPVSPYSGTTTVTKNSPAYVDNNGWDVNIMYDLIQSDNLKLTLRANGNYNKNSVGGLPLGNPIFSGADPQYVTQNNGMIDEVYAYQYLGVNQSNGNLLFQAADGTVTENPVFADRKATGKNRLPVYQGGFGFDVDYKGFFASATFTYAFKVWRYDYDLANLYDVNANIGQFTLGSDLLNAWTPTNTNTDVPSLTAANFAAQDNSDRFLKDASYVRMRNLQVGYRIPKKLIEKTFIKDASLTLQGENLFNITRWQGFDPESDRDFDVYQYPTPRIYTMTLDIKF
jgi:TonB-linked SusC/RagA family outer membrane protein